MFFSKKRTFIIPNNRINNTELIRKVWKMSSKGEKLNHSIYRIHSSKNNKYRIQSFLTEEVQHRIADDKYIVGWIVVIYWEFNKPIWTLSLIIVCLLQNGTNFSQGSLLSEGLPAPWESRSLHRRSVCVWHYVLYSRVQGVLWRDIWFQN